MPGFFWKNGELKMDYESALDFIHGRYKFKKHANLDTIKRLLKELGNPEKSLKIIHVGGTNGKGSTVSYLKNIFMAEGKTVGTFTSPFITRFNERISVNGQPISDDDLVELVTTIKPIVDKLDLELAEDGPTEFEIITAMMFLFFSQQPIDVAIVEVGIGGILDSTNVLTPVVSVITTIGMDHMQLLGNTIQEIATQKAGIIKDKRDVVIGNVNDEAMEVFIAETKAKKSALYAFDNQFTISNLKNTNRWTQTFDYEDDQVVIRKLESQLLGEYQSHNAACAIKAYLLYKKFENEDASRDAIVDGIKKTTWPGRFEKVNELPLVVLDGAHNVDAMNQLKKLIKNYFSGTEIYIIIGILSDKNYMEMLNIIGSINNVHLVLTKFEAYGSRQSADVDQIASSIKSKNDVQVIDDWREAIANVASEISDDDMILVTGSLYFISDVRKLFTNG